jgi:hypothetical protein
MISPMTIFAPVGSLHTTVSNADLEYSAEAFLDHIEDRFDRKEFARRIALRAELIYKSDGPGYGWYRDAISLGFDSLLRGSDHYSTQHLHAARFFAHYFRIAYIRSGIEAKREMLGRLEHCLNSDMGFSALFLELAVGISYLSRGLDVDFMSSCANDVTVRSRVNELTAECKAVQIYSKLWINREAVKELGQALIEHAADDHSKFLVAEYCGPVGVSRSETVNSLKAALDHWKASGERSSRSTWWSIFTEALPS